MLLCSWGYRLKCAYIKSARSSIHFSGRESGIYLQWLQIKSRTVHLASLLMHSKAGVHCPRLHCCNAYALVAVEINPRLPSTEVNVLRTEEPPDLMGTFEALNPSCIMTYWWFNSPKPSDSFPVRQVFAQRIVM